ncbi:MAG: hypothetical protein EXS12_06125 [Phycisphaerales bacterium]|nr:hypothetical protein [Phycisphaerales bacterium]
MFGGVALLVLTLSCFFRCIGIRDINRGFVLGGIPKLAWLRVWFLVNCINCLFGAVVGFGVILINCEIFFNEDGKNHLVKIENIWIILLVLELLITTRVINAAAIWLESTWVQVFQAIVVCMILFSFALHMTLSLVPQTPDDIGVATLIRTGAILTAAAVSLVSIWWITDGVTRMTLALANEVGAESPKAV